MYVLTGSAMREADRRTIEDVGIPSRVLMENAGRAVAAILGEEIPGIEEGSIAVVCGKGNNGGDGLVVLRQLIHRGYDARGYVLAPFEELSTDAIDNLQAALKLGLPVESIPSEEAWADALAELAGADVVIDAILGTGLSSAARGLPRRAIEDLNELDAIKIALDVPSGLSSDTGRELGPAVDATLSIALAAPKVCHFIPPACRRCGKVEIAEIGIPPGFLTGPEPSLEIIDPEALSALWPARSADTHKGSFGHLLIVGGSVGKTGAALMAAKAALRSGVGLVTVASAKSAIPMMAPGLPEAMWEPLPETDTGGLDLDALESLERLSGERDAVALGPGLGRHEKTVELLRKLVAKLSLPTVIDADGLNALAGALDAIPSGAAVAITPHPGEAGRLLGRSATEIQAERLEAARELAERSGASVVLKGYRSLVCDPNGNAKINFTGNAGMATGGTGDVLTGILGSLAAQSIPFPDALALGVHLHGLAGDLAASELGKSALVATDLIGHLPAALRELGAA